MSDLKEAQVVCAGVSYFEVHEALDANGDVRKDGAGNPIKVTLRKEAKLGDVINVTPVEFDRLASLDAVREPSDAPLLERSGMATPFGVPVKDRETGFAIGYAGPVMGDPNPGNGLSREDAARLAAVADGEADLNGDSEPDPNQEPEVIEGDYEDHSVEDLKSEIERRNADREDDDKIAVEGTGQSGRVIKDDLVLALEADDEENED